MVLLTIPMQAARPGDIAGQYYSTDIRTYLNGVEIDAINIGGQTLISGEDMLLGEVESVSAYDRMELFDRYDRRCKPYLNLSVHEIAQRQAMLHGEDTAVIFHGEKITRAALEHRACQIANALCAAGVRRGGRVGLAMARTPDLFAGMLGILKNGCAYVPLLASLPEKRLVYMAETAEMCAILTDEVTLPTLPASLREIAVVAGTDLSKRFKSVSVSGSDLINVLFTSGSTGQPKGTMVRHSSASNLLANVEEMLQGVTGPMICATTVIFDIFMTESLLPLAMGRTIVLADEEDMVTDMAVDYCAEEK